LNCSWAKALSTYDCRQVTGLHGEAALEIGTPFSLPDGSAINLYLVPHGAHVLVSDNGDTLFKIASLGLDVWNSNRLKSVRATAAVHGVSLDSGGDLRALAQIEHAPYVFAKTVSGILAVADWAAEQINAPTKARDLVAEAEPYIIARNPAWVLERKKAVLGASRARYTFDLRHGPDLIDVVPPVAQATGGVMRKCGDVLNGGMLDGLKPLIIVDDRYESEAAHQEISIIGSVTRAMPFSRLMQPPQALH
jgi:hypothetical protein